MRTHIFSVWFDHSIDFKINLKRIWCGKTGSHVTLRSSWVAFKSLDAFILLCTLPRHWKMTYYTYKQHLYVCLKVFVRKTIGEIDIWSIIAFCGFKSRFFLYHHCNIGPRRQKDAGMWLKDFSLDVCVLFSLFAIQLPNL